MKGLPPSPNHRGPSCGIRSAPLTPLLALPHPPICTLICLPNSSVPSCFGFNKYFDGVWAGFWDCVLGANLEVGEVNIAGKILFSTSLLPVPASFHFI